MPGHITSMSVRLEDTVRRLDAEHLLRWDDAYNHANYYHESTTNGFFDGIAACLEALAARFELVEKKDANSSHFLREASSELWATDGPQREWRNDRSLPLATALLDLVTALEIESRRVTEQSGPSQARYT